MYFREMEYVVTVAECRSITAAAKKLFISQPSLSYALGRIEENLGVKLFDRTHQPLTLTYAGEKYVAAAKDILVRNSNLEKELKDIAEGKKIEISFGIPTERAGYMLPGAIQKLRAIYPNVEFRMKEAKTDELLKMVQEYEIDFMVAPTRRDRLTPGLTAELVCYESVPLIAPEGYFTDDMYIDRNRRYIDLKALDGRPFIAVKQGHSIRARVDSILSRFGVQPKVLVEVDSSNTALQLAQCGLGATIVPGRTLRLLGDDCAKYTYIYEETPAKWAVNAIYHSDIYLNEAERCFINILKEEFGLPLDRPADAL